MKNLIITIIILLCFGIIFSLSKPNLEREMPQDGQTPEIVADIPPNTVEGEYGIEDLLDAIEQVESGGNPNAVGDGGDAVGSFQIHKIYVDDVNRILALLGFDKRYTYADRWDKAKSRKMVFYYTKYYRNATFYGRDREMGIELEMCARIHNGGPTGYKKESTKPYWEKVKRELMEKQ